MTALPQDVGSDLERENARLRDELRAARERQTATSDILKVIASSPSDVQPVFDVIVEHALRLCGGRMGRVYRYDNGIIHLVAGQGLSAPGLSKVQEVFPRPAADDTTAGRAIQSRRPYFVADIETDQSVPALSRQMIEALGTRSQVTIPMLRSGEPIGAITVGWAEPGAYGDQQVALLQTFADQAVIAIENARLFNETREALERQTATADILKVIASSPSDVQPVFEAIATSANRLIGGFSSTVFRLIDGVAYLKAFTPTTPAADEVLQATFPRPAADFPPFRMAQAGEVTQIPDTEALSDEILDISRARGFRSMLFAPLMNDGTSIGFIVVTRGEPGTFADHHVQLLRTFADQAVIAIENARLFEEVQARTRELTESLEQQTATSEVLSVISSSAGDLAPVFDAMLSKAMQLCGADFGVLNTYDGELFHTAATHGLPPVYDEYRRNQPLDYGRGTAPARLLQGEPIVEITDLLESEAYRKGEPNRRALVDVGGARSLLAVPLLKDERVVGNVMIFRQEKRRFSEKQIALLKQFAAQAVIAIENTRLLRELRASTEDLRESLQQQTATAEVLQIISSSPGDLAPVFEKMLENATRVCGAEFGSMNLVEDGSMRQAALYNAPAAFAAARINKVSRPHPQSLMTTAVRTKQVIHLPDLRTTPAYLERAAATVELVELGGARTVATVPMLRDDEVIGVITIYRQEVRPFGDKQIELLSNFAKQAVIAIENARLLKELRQRTADLSRSLDELRTAQDRLVQTEKLASLGQLTAGIAHEIKNPLNFVNNFSALSAELTDELNDVLKQTKLADKVREEVDELTRLLKHNLEKVVQHGKRADSIVKNMLLHSREGSGDHRPADINALLDESLNLAYHGARAEKPQFNVTLQRNFDPNAGLIEVFPQEITRVFLNLISNGFYAVTKRKAENGTGFDPVVSATTRDRGDHVEIRIRDNGIGIPPHVKEKMFNPFFTTKPAGEGTGLGLSMSHDIIVKQHGGTIDVVTEPGQFTEFTVVLPRASNLSNKTRG